MILFACIIAFGYHKIFLLFVSAIYKQIIDNFGLGKFVIADI